MIQISVALYSLRGPFKMYPMDTFIVFYGRDTNHFIHDPTHVCIACPTYVFWEEKLKHSTGSIRISDESLASLQYIS